MTAVKFHMKQLPTLMTCCNIFKAGRAATLYSQT